MVYLTCKSDALINLKKSSDYPQITIRVSQFEFKRFKELKDNHNLSAREVLEYSGCGCEKCKGIYVIAFDKENGDEIKIPRGILGKRIQ